MKILSLPTLADSGLSAYISQVNKFPFLDEKEELSLANRWLQSNDIEAAHTLVTSHLRLVVKIAMGFRGYGLAVTDIISEGNIGLMQAVKRFNPSKGFRLSTYAMWWIKAAINEYILRSWSMVKMGTTAAQKKLFFNLKKIKQKIFSANDEHNANRELLPSEIAYVSSELDVPQRDVIEIDQRMTANDTSLNVVVGGVGDVGSELIEYLEDDSENQEVVFEKKQNLESQKMLLEKAMMTLTDRERNIIAERKLKEKPSTLDELSRIYSISRERIRQIEARAMEKLQAVIMQSV